MSDMSSKVDLGNNHWLRFTTWKPDLNLNPQYKGLESLILDTRHVGAIVTHVKPDGNLCEGGIMFDCELVRLAFPERECWTVESWDPLTLSPSLLCQCGDHGFIRGGKWVPV